MVSDLFFKDFLDKNWPNIFSYLNNRAADVCVMASNIYNSCDIRYSGFKVANVDCNLFPAGFKNVSQDGFERCKNQLIKFIETKKNNGSLKSAAKNVVIVSESHTRNLPYLHGVFKLKQIFENAGFNVRLATFDLKKFKVKLSGDVIEVFKLIKKDGKVYLECDGYKNQATTQIALNADEGEVIFETCPETGKLIPRGSIFEADYIVINNDMTVQSPAVLDDCIIPAFPQTRLGWHLRKKSNHFEKYRLVVEEFAKNFNIDSWLFSAIFDFADNIDIKDGNGIDGLAKKVDDVIRKTKEKYLQHGIKSDVKTYIKANAGTYGMGVMMLNNAEELLSLNKSGRNKLDSIKAGIKSTSFIIQEGISSILNVDGNPAELVCYGFNLTPCDFFYRYHPDKDSNNSLNAPGAKFVNQNNFDLINNKINTAEVIAIKLSYIASALAFIACGLE